jgi:hypothetical protein
MLGNPSISLDGVKGPRVVSSAYKFAVLCCATGKKGARKAQEVCSKVRNPPYPLSRKTKGVRTISREVCFVKEQGITPQRLHAEHPNSTKSGMDGDIV